MNRDDGLYSAVRRNTSIRGATSFAHLAETIARSCEPTATQLQELERAYNATGEYLTECPEFEGLLTNVHAQGSRSMGTMVRPLDPKREGFDIDLVARLAAAAMRKYGGQTGAELLLQHLFTALQRYADRHGLSIKRWERCVTLMYAGGMKADFAPVIDDPLYTVLKGEHHGRIPDRELKAYLSTNPKGYCLGFDDAAKTRLNFVQYEALAKSMTQDRKAGVEPLPDAEGVFARLLSRFVQLVKVHRNNAFADIPSGKDLAPTSVFLNSLVAKAYVILAPQPHDGPLDLFFDIVQLLPALFVREDLAGGHQHWSLQNPYAQNDNLAESMNTPQRQQAFDQWHSLLVQHMDKLLTAVEGSQGLDAVGKAVEDAFGSRASQAVLQSNAQRRDGNRALQRVGFVIAGTTSVTTAARAHTYFGGVSK